MNTVVLKAKKGNQYQLGDIFKNPEKPKELYMLTETGSGGFSTVCLSDGKTFNSPCKTIESAVTGLTFYGRDYTITIE